MAYVMLLGPDRRHASDIRSLLRQDGHETGYCTEIDAWQAREREILPELIVATVDSAEQVLMRQSERGVAGFPSPMLFIQKNPRHHEDEVHLDDRLVDRISAPFLDEELLARVDALVRVGRVIRQTSLTSSEDATRVRSSRSVGSRVAAMLHTRVPRLEKPVDPYLQVASRVAQWADRRDAYEPGHAERVTSFCAMMGDALDLDDRETAALLRAAMLHDIGKIGLPVEMLHQKAPLEESQMKQIRTHPKRGAALIRALEPDEDIAEAILCHHERPDGFGYYGLDEERIPRPARILAVAEVYDGMTTTRLADPMPTPAALDRLESFKGISLDQDCVDALVDRLRPVSRSVNLGPATGPRAPRAS